MREHRTSKEIFSKKKKNGNYLNLDGDSKE